MQDEVHFVGIVEEAAFGGVNGLVLQDVEQIGSFGVMIKILAFSDPLQFQVFADHAASRLSVCPFPSKV